ncbi:hypothetical protein D3C79_1030140 [compost metagenome]
MLFLVLEVDGPLSHFDHLAGAQKHHAVFVCHHRIAGVDNHPATLDGGTELAFQADHAGGNRAGTA